MANVATFTKTGSKASVAVKLPKEVFELEVKNHELIKAAYVAYLANGRQNLAKTKTRGDVSGGGKKPWRQKGTGRARFGSTRVPIWRKGGVAHGPTGGENYSHNLSTGDKRLARRQALSLKANAGAVIILEEIEVKSAKTKDFVALLEKVGAKRNTLVITANVDESTKKASANCAYAKLVRARSTNVFDVMNADLVVATKDAIAEIAAWLGGKS